MRTAVPRSRALPTALALLVAMSALLAGATTAGALPRDADAVGIRAELDVTVGDVATSVDGTIGQLSGPPSNTTQVFDADASLGDDTATVAAVVVRSQVISNALESRAESDVAGASVSVPLLDDLLGGTLVSTGVTVIRAEAICPAGASPTASVDPLASVMIAGEVVMFEADGSATAELDVDDVSAGTVELQLDATVVTTSTAAAAALTLRFSVDLADGAGSVTGTVTIAEVSCEAPAAPMAGAIDSAQGSTSGGTLVQISGTGFVPGATTVEIGGNVVPASAVSVAPAGDSLTFRTPAHAAGQVGVTATTPDGTTALLGFLYVAPVDPPTATGISPTSGPVTGGTAVTITGTGFQPGVTTVTIGGISVPSSDIIVALGGASLTFTSPAHVAGPVDVTVTTPAGTASPALGFAYVAATGPAPTTTAITPAEGPTTGGTTVTVTGTDFVPDATTVTIDGVVVPAAVATGGSSLTFSTPSHAVGPVAVTVTTAGGTATPALGFTYVAAGPAPTTTTITPAEGPITGGTTVTVTGTGFVPDATMVAIGGVPVLASVAPGGTNLTFTTPPHAAGLVGVTVTTTGGTTVPALAFTYVAPAAPAPTAAAITPAEGPTAGGTTVTITGTGFVPGATMVATGGVPVLASVAPGGTTVTIGGVPVTATVAPGGTSLTFATPPHPAGPVDVTITTAGGITTPALGFTYVAPAGPAPLVTAITPDQGPSTGGTPVVITGSGFVPGATSVTIGGITVATGEVVVGPDGTSLTFTTPPHAAGAVDVTVTTPGGTSTPTLGFTHIAVPPTATELDIHQGPTAGGTKVTITGSGFLPGETTVTIDDDVIPADQVDVADDGMSLSFTSPAHDAGDVEITVTTPGGTTSPPLTYAYASPTTSGTGTVGTGVGTAMGTDTGGSTAAGNGATGGRLATTGSEVADLVVLALAAIGTGGTLLWSRRRALRHTAAAA